MTNKIVEVQHLSHRYGIDWAIKDINFSIESKGVFGLLGPNGAGKSTTMNIICNVLTQTQGDVFINGVNLKTEPIAAKKYIGFLPQVAPLHKELTVDEYLTHCARLRMMPEGSIEENLNRVKTICGLQEYSHKLINGLSGGYQQRVGIAQAIIHNPPFVVLDEPTNGLDPNQILVVRKLIKDIAKEKAVLISTHILSEVQATCDYIMMINHGNVVFKGSIHDFDTYMDPSALFVSLHFPPTDEEMMKIEGVERIERLTKNRIRVHFIGDDGIIQRFMETANAKQWGLNEIYLEKESLDKVFAKLSGKL